MPIVSPVPMTNEDDGQHAEPVALRALAWVACDERLGPRLLALTGLDARSEEHTSELQSLMRNSYAVFCLQKNNPTDDDSPSSGPQPQKKDTTNVSTHITHTHDSR